MSDYCDTCDCLMKFCECNSIDKIYIIDLETTSNNLRDAKILEISIYSVELPDLEYKEVFHCIVKREDLDESEKNKWLMKHSKLTSVDLEKGKSSDYVSKKLAEILDNSAITSLDINFDLRLLNKEFSIDKKISYFRLPCVLDTASKYCKIPTTRPMYDYTYKRDIRALKLDYAHQSITGKKIDSISHRVSEDAKIAAEIVVGLIKRGKYDLSELSKGKYTDLHFGK